MRYQKKKHDSILKNILIKQANTQADFTKFGFDKLHNHKKFEDDVHKNTNSKKKYLIGRLISGLTNKTNYAFDKLENNKIYTLEQCSKKIKFILQKLEDIQIKYVIASYYKLKKYQVMHQGKIEGKAQSKRQWVFKALYRNLQVIKEMAFFTLVSNKSYTTTCQNLRQVESKNRETHKFHYILNLISLQDLN